MADLIQTCAILSHACYSASVPDGLGILGYEQILCEGTDTLAMVYVTQGALYIAVAGSESLRDWIGNSRIIKASFHGIKAHRGFARAAESILVDVMQIIARNPRPEVVLTGHSLGGAIATLLAVALRPKAIRLITFGQPKVATAQELRLALFGEYIRVVNGSDIVPRLPRFKYSHAGTCVYLSNSGKRLLDPGWLRMFIDRTITLGQHQRGTDHRSTDYSKEYARCVESQ
ncbi:MAG: lipase family protein [Gammaproteobacteria bacterium]|nr:lipase family protein [Gammaproteobacteria bacterium]